MKLNINPTHYLNLIKVIGFSLLFFYHILGGGHIGFFLLLVLMTTFVLRVRIKKVDITIYFDFLLTMFMIIHFDLSPYILLVVLIEALAKGKYFVLLGVIYFYQEPIFMMFILLTSLLGFTTRRWIKERDDNIIKYFHIRGELHELEESFSQYNLSVKQDIQKAVVSERTRISRDIHDNAGHDLIAAYISFQTIQDLIEDDSVNTMYTETLNRLSDGVNKIRDILHNIASTEVSGIFYLEKICKEYPSDIDFKYYGNMNDIEPHIWSVLSTCLKEALNNIARHAKAKNIRVNIDVSKHIIRMSIENDGVTKDKKISGRGMSNMRHRIRSIGGNLSVNKENDTFSLICVIPLIKEKK